MIDLKSYANINLIALESFSDCVFDHLIDPLKLFFIPNFSIEF